MSFWSAKGTTELRPLKYLARFNPEVLSEDTNPDFEFDYIDIGGVTLEDGIRHTEAMRFETAPSRARKPVRPGDVIVSTVRTYLKAVARIGEAHNGAIVSTGFAVLRPNADVDAGYLYRLCQANAFVADVEARSTGVSYPAINPSALAAIKVPFPDVDTQKAIAAFLDRETTLIDKLIAKKKLFQETIAAKRKALTAALVDGSLIHGNERAGQVGWFGQLPAHWPVRRARFLFREHIDPSQDGSEELLTVSHITGVTARAEKDVNMFMAETLEGYKLAQANDLVVNTMWAWMGAIGVSPIHGCASPSYAVYRPEDGLFRPDYLDLVVRSLPFVAEVNRRSKGIWASRLRLYPDAFLDIPFPVPPIEEQGELVATLKARMQREESIAAKSERSIALLKERRAALITAAIAGQVDIRENLPAVTSTSDRGRFRLVVGAEIIHQHRSNPKFGRVKLQKELYLAEAHLGIGELQGNYFRQAAGPLDHALIEETEHAVEAAGFYRASQANGAGTSVTYAPLPNAGRHSAELKSLLGPRADSLGGLIALLRDFGTEAVEAITTLYAVWNDALMDGRQLDDPTIVNGVLTEWHEEKGNKFKDSDLRHWLDWMKRNGLTPRGQGPRTAHTMTRDMFA